MNCLGIIIIFFIYMNDKKNYNEHFKTIQADFKTEVLYCVPTKWKHEDLKIKYGILYYKGEPQEQIQTTDFQSPYQSPPTLIEIKDDDVEKHFDVSEMEKQIN